MLFLNVLSISSSREHGLVSCATSQLVNINEMDNVYE